MVTEAVPGSLELGSVALVGGGPDDRPGGSQRPEPGTAVGKALPMTGGKKSPAPSRKREPGRPARVVPAASFVLLGHGVVGGTRGLNHRASACLSLGITPLNYSAAPVRSGKKAGGEGRNRTDEWGFCRALPYHLATPPQRTAANIKPSRLALQALAPVPNTRDSGPIIRPTKASNLAAGRLGPPDFLRPD